MKNVLIVSGHTNLQGDSFASKIILEDLQAKLSNATFKTNGPSNQMGHLFYLFLFLQFLQIPAISK